MYCFIPLCKCVLFVCFRFIMIEYMVPTVWQFTNRNSDFAYRICLNANIQVQVKPLLHEPHHRYPWCKRYTQCQYPLLYENDWRVVVWHHQLIVLTTRVVNRTTLVPSSHATITWASACYVCLTVMYTMFNVQWDLL